MRQIKGLIYGEVTRNRWNLLLGLILLGASLLFLLSDLEASSHFGTWASRDMLRPLLTFLLMVVTVAVPMQRDSRGRLRMHRSTLERLLPTGTQKALWVALVFQCLLVAVLSIGHLLVWHDAFRIRTFGDGFAYFAMTAIWSASLIWMALANAALRWLIMLVVSAIAAYAALAEETSSFARLLFFLYGLHVIVFILREQEEGVAARLARRLLSVIAFRPTAPKSRLGALIWVQSRRADWTLPITAFLLALWTMLRPFGLEFAGPEILKGLVFLLGFFWEREALSRSLGFRALPISSTEAGLHRAAYTGLMALGAAFLYTIPTATATYISKTPPAIELDTLWGASGVYSREALQAIMILTPSSLAFWLGYSLTLALVLWVVWSAGRVLILALIASTLNYVVASFGVEFSTREWLLLSLGIVGFLVGINWTRRTDARTLLRHRVVSLFSLSVLLGAYNSLPTKRTEIMYVGVESILAFGITLFLIGAAYFHRLFGFLSATAIVALLVSILVLWDLLSLVTRSSDMVFEVLLQGGFIAMLVTFGLIWPIAWLDFKRRG